MPEPRTLTDPICFYSGPLGCDSCGAASSVRDGRLPDGWTAERLPSCQWPFTFFVSCPRCGAERDAAHHRRTGAAR